MSVQILTNQPSQSPHDNRVSGGARAASPQAPAAPADSAVVVDVHAAIGNENAASAATDVHDLAAAGALMSQLVSQIADQPASAHSAQNAPSPQAVLSLLS